MIDMKVPEMGESITEVVLVAWLKADGDYVELDEPVCELDSDKATFEVPAEASGILRIVAQKSNILRIGAMICKIEAGGEATSNSKKRLEGKNVATVYSFNFVHFLSKLFFQKNKPL